MNTPNQQEKSLGRTDATFGGAQARARQPEQQGGPMINKRIMILILSLALLATTALLYIKTQSIAKKDEWLDHTSKTKLTISYPETMKIKDTSYDIAVTNEDFDLFIQRALYTSKNDPSTTGGDSCGGTAEISELTKVGTLDGKAVYRKDGRYYAYYDRYHEYCWAINVYTEESPDFDQITVYYKYLNPSLTQAQREEYTRIADQIVLSIRR